jgi:N-acetylneuraminic acid mutarotase
MRKIIEQILMVLVLIAIAAGLVATYYSAYLVEIPAPMARLSPGTVYDPQLQKTVIFGGGFQDSSGFELYDDMWKYDSARNIWCEIIPTNKPSARSGHKMVYDSFNQKTILFGGYNEIFGLRNDIWLYDSQSNQWTEVFPLVSPDSRQSHAMCYDPEYRKIIMFGGYRESVFNFDDTWVYDYSINLWTELHPTIRPSARYGAKMVYDPINQRIILFGGRNTTILDDTWVYYYGNNTWMELTTTGNPDTRYWHGMVYDSDMNKVIVFGGRHIGAPGEALDDTWVLNPSTNVWTEIHPTTHPTNRMEPMMIYDPYSHKTVLFGGFRFQDTTLGDTWTYEFGSNSWSIMKKPLF